MANNTVYPFGTNGELPSSIGIINDLFTGGADKALSAEMGKEIGDYLYGEIGTEDISGIEEMSAYIASAEGTANYGKWINTGGYKCKFIPVDAGPVKIVNTGGGNTYVAVLTDTTHNINELPSYTDGFSAPVKITENEELVVNVINGCYLYVTTTLNNVSVGVSIIRRNGTSQVQALISGAIADNFDGEEGKALSAAKGKELHEQLGWFKTIELATTAAYISLPGYTWISASGYTCALISVAAGETYRITPNSNGRCQYAFLANNEIEAGETPNFVEGCVPTHVEVGTQPIITIPDGCAYLYVSTHTTVDITPTVERAYPIQDIAEEKSTFPSMLYFGEPTNIIYTIDDFLLAHEYDEGQNIDNLKFSTDLGKTWATIANTFGVITNAFRFADGTFMMCCQQSDGMHFLWSRDFETFNDCVVYDYDGEPYQTRSGDRRCFINRPRYQHLYVDNTEYYLIGDYVFPEFNSASANPRLWYAISEDAGVTMRCAFAFGLQQIDGVTIPARHVHNFEYNPYNGYFYAMTGDHGENECNVMRGRHVNHVWTWERLAHGQQYKVMYPVFDEGNIYLTTDYTDSSLVNAKGIVRVPVNRFDFDNFHYLFHATAEFMLEGSIYANQPAAIAQMVTDNHGWRFLITDYIGNSKHLIAKGNHNFVWVDNTTGKKFDGIIGPNSNGDVYVSAKTPSANVPETSLKISHKTTYNLTEAMRNSGATDFFKDFVNSVY